MQLVCEFLLTSEWNILQVGRSKVSSEVIIPDDFSCSWYMIRHTTLLNLNTFTKEQF